MPLLTKEKKYNQSLAGLIPRWREDWCLFAREVLNVNLDPQQDEILKRIQRSKRIAIRSGHARGKDFIGAVASLCFLYLNYPSKVIETAPSERQAINIMMAEIKTIMTKTKINLGGEPLTKMIKFSKDPNWFLIAFKTQDMYPEKWTGFHSPNLMVVVTEASGIDSRTYEALEGLLTGNSKLLIIGNPNRTSGEFYNAFRATGYEKFALDCLDAVNVKTKTIQIPGQVDYEWVKDKVFRWTRKIEKEEFNSSLGDFEFEGEYYRPNDLFLVKVRGWFPNESPDTLIPLTWLENAYLRYESGNKIVKQDTKFRLGVDVAGMGNNLTVFTFRYGNFIKKFKAFSHKDPMQIVGEIQSIFAEHRYSDPKAFIDTIGEGAGIYSRLKELKINAQSVKFSESGEGLTDITGNRTFINMRAFVYWALRDTLNPEFNCDFRIPENDYLTEDLTSMKYSINSQGKIVIQPKDEITKEIGRSPDFGDSLANTFYPDCIKEPFVDEIRTNIDPRD